MWQIAVLPFAAAGFVAETTGNAAFRLFMGGISVMGALTHWGAKAEPCYEGRVRFFGSKSGLQPDEEMVDGSDVSGTVLALSRTYRVRAGCSAQASKLIFGSFKREHLSIKAGEAYVLPASLKRV